MFFFLLFAFVSCAALAQSPLPPFSFKPNSTSFANSNFHFVNQESGFTETDTLTDETILASLAKILDSNPDLQIELVGHTTFGEAPELGLQRAETVKNKLVERQLAAARIRTLNKADTEPVISGEVLMTLENQLERDEAERRNRRVEVRVIKPMTK